MVLCQKCWDDAHLRMMDDPTKTQTDHYLDLIKERNGCVESTHTNHRCWLRVNRTLLERGRA